MGVGCLRNGDGSLSVDLEGDKFDEVLVGGDRSGHRAPLESVQVWGFSNVVVLLGSVSLPTPVHYDPGLRWRRWGRVGPGVDTLKRALNHFVSWELFG